MGMRTDTSISGHLQGTNLRTAEITSGTAMSTILRQVGTPTVFQMSADLIAVTLGFVVFYFLKLQSAQTHPLVTTAEFFFTVLVSSALFWVSVYWLAGLYKNWYIRSPFDEAWTVVKATSTAGIIVLAVMSIDSGYLRIKLIPYILIDRKSTRLNSSHEWISRMPSSA